MTESEEISTCGNCSCVEYSDKGYFYCGVFGFDYQVDDYMCSEPKGKPDWCPVDELKKYRSLGTVEELHKAVEKRKKNPPYMYGDGYADGSMVYDMYECPGCGESYEIDGGKYDFCPKCGQAIDWR